MAPPIDVIFFRRGKEVSPVIFAPIHHLKGTVPSACTVPPIIGWGSHEVQFVAKPHQSTKQSVWFSTSISQSHPVMASHLGIQLGIFLLGYPNGDLTGTKQMESLVSDSPNGGLSDHDFINLWGSTPQIDFWVQPQSLQTLHWVIKIWVHPW